MKKFKALLKRYGEKKIKRILFTDKKIFTVEESFNKQNDHVYPKSVKVIPHSKRKVKRIHHPVWAGASRLVKAPLHFVEQRVKVGATIYLKDVLAPVVHPPNQALFDGSDWILQQGSAQTHKAKMFQN